MKYRIIKKGKTNPKYKIQQWGKSLFISEDWFDLTGEISGVWFWKTVSEKWIRRSTENIIWFNTKEEAENKLKKILEVDAEEEEITVKEVGAKKSKISKS